MKILLEIQGGSTKENIGKLWFSAPEPTLARGTAADPARRVLRAPVCCRVGRTFGERSKVAEISSRIIPLLTYSSDFGAARLDPCELRTVVPYTYTLSEPSAELHDVEESAGPAVESGRGHIVERSSQDRPQFGYSNKTKTHSTGDIMTPHEPPPNPIHNGVPDQGGGGRKRLLNVVRSDTCRRPRAPDDPGRFLRHLVEFVRSTK
ncbi:hypothetical protein EVAR_33986_1 [Eumeta japonica]|uniref:Uncharacterized protein n=1 Tax=Eumeta variegata TaxID=151549 RepID=A0A4C1X3I2_EUMVA|nr:hypothetical protein EVAR_33986_1 [Eumeta japonica]